MTSMFSDNNSPCILDHVDLSVVAINPPRPSPLKRGTNDWINYFGAYPYACAEITRDIHAYVGRTGNRITRHVLQIPIDSSNLRLYPTNREISAVQRDVRDKVEWIYMQLETFSDNGSITLKKTTGGAEIEYQGERIYVNFYICEETSMFHVLISKRSRYITTGLIYPDMDNVSSMMYCLRMIFITPGLFPSFNFDLNQDDIERASVVTFELSLVQPEPDPEWMNDENSSWKADPTWRP